MKSIVVVFDNCALGEVKRIGRGVTHLIMIIFIKKNEFSEKYTFLSLKI